MAYNNGFPIGYQPINNYQMQQQNQPQFTQVQTQANNTGGIIWVQGEAGAKSYLVAPNNSVTLWDSESQTIYVKSADASGIPSIKVLDYKIRDNSENTRSQIDFKTFATKDDVSMLEKRLNALAEELTNGEVVDNE